MCSSVLGGFSLTMWPRFIKAVKLSVHQFSQYTVVKRDKYTLGCFWNASLWHEIVTCMR